jgi:broad specificity phosphatase PhoE
MDDAQVGPVEPGMDRLWLARHGATEWSRSRRHTGVTDLDLTTLGVREATALGARLSPGSFAAVLSSPARRARRTAEIAGFGEDVHVDGNLAEYDYGDYEGLTTEEIRRRNPDWDLWRDGCPGGETTGEVAARADLVLASLEPVDGEVLVFAHGHVSRVLAARFLALEPGAAGRLSFSTAALSILGFEHERSAILLWNDTCHLEGLDRTG